jgi:hypothetical protein
MVNATIQNLSTFKRDHWVTVTFPTTKVQDYGVECRFVTAQGDTWRAVKGSQNGQKTVFRIHAILNGSQTIKGQLQNTPIGPEDTIPQFKAHEWVIDDPIALMPELFGMECEIVSPPKIVSQSPAHMRWHTRMKVPKKGLILEWWADILHDDPIVPCKGKIVWSDRNDPRANRTFDVGELKLAIGEFFIMDFQTRKGIQPPIQVDPSRWVSVINDKLITLNDGAGIPLSLNLLAYTQKEMTDHDPEDFDRINNSIRNMQAAWVGGVVGVCNDWDGDWCAAKNIPEAYPAHIMDADADVQMFKDQMSVNMGHFEPIPIGIGKTPGQTGAQEDFGATKGTHVVLSNRPDYIQALQFVSYYELFRGTNHYEESGNPLNADDHPQWVTWNGGTHWHTGVSPDRLGKTENAPPGTGWFGYDDQHRSQNNFAAYAMLSDDPLIGDQLYHQLQTDKACHRIKFGSAGATRAQGRHVGAWAQFLTITDGEERAEWKKLIDERVRTSSRVPTLNVDGPMKTLNAKGPDGRKGIYKDGALAPTTSMWEHGLAIVGLYKAYKNNPTDELREVLTKVAHTLLKYGWFTESGRYYVVADIIWKDGEHVDLKLANGWDGKSANPMTQQFMYSEGGRGVNEWTVAGLRVAREFLNYNDTKLNHLLSGDSTSQGDSEWRAIVNS